MNISIVYWTGTGNTQMMAEAIVDSLEELGFDPKFDFVNDADLLDIEEADMIFFGSPARTGEDIEEMEFRPFFEDAKKYLKDKKVVLFGSYDWGGGQWIETWAEEVEAEGAKVISKIKVQWNPEDEQIEAIKKEVTELVS